MAPKVRATFGWIGQVLSWLVILGVVVVLAAAVVVPRLAGATPYTVLTGSMEPDYPPGTLVVVKPVEFDEIGIGQVITYQLESGKADVVTHRVVGTANRFDGQRVLVTQGDANQAPDPERVQAVQVKGELWYSVPYLGHLNTVLSGSQRQWAVLAVSALLIGYAAFMFVSSIRDRRRRKRGPAGPAAVGQEVGAPAAPLAAPPAPPLETPLAPPEKPADDERSWLPLAAAAVVVLAVLVLIRARATRTTHHTGRSST